MGFRNCKTRESAEPASDSDYDVGLDRMNEQIFPLMRSAGLRD